MSPFPSNLPVVMDSFWRYVRAVRAGFFALLPLMVVTGGAILAGEPSPQEELEGAYQPHIEKQQPPAAAPSPAATQPPQADSPLPQRADSLIAPPKADEIAAFANDVKLPHDFKGLALNVDKEKVLEFFAYGEAHPIDKERARWRLLADFTLPVALASTPALAEARLEAAGMPNGRVYFNAFIHTGGVVATKAGTFYFWQFWNDRVLEVKDETGCGCLLVLGENAKPPAMPFAAAVHPYGEFDGAAEPDKKLYGKLTVPQSKDIVGFANRPGDADAGLRRNYLSRERLDAYLTMFNPMSKGMPQLCRFDGSLNPFTGVPPDPGTRTRLMGMGMANIQMQFEGPFSAGSVTDGVLLARDGRVLFWRMGGDGFFYLMDDHHRTNCVTSQFGGDTARRYNDAFVQFTLEGNPKLSLLTYGELMSGDEWRLADAAPLAPGDAARSAWKQLAAATGGKDAAAWRLSRVTMTRYSSNFGLCRWYYTVYFVKQGDPARAETPVLVSMSGTAGGIYAPDEANQKLAESQTQYNTEAQKRFRGFRGGFGGGPNANGVVFGGFGNMD